MHRHREERRTWGVIKELFGAGARVVLVIAGLVACGRSREA
jgi:hypothetical protein